MNWNDGEGITGVKGILGVFKETDKCADAIRALKATGEKKLEVFSPMPVHEIEAALGQKKSPIGWATLTGALVGLVSGFALSAFTAVKYDLITSGKPIMAWIPWLVVGFEFTILFGCLANFITMILMAGLPRWKKPPVYDERFSVDAFGIFVPCRGEEVERMKHVLSIHGAEEVHERS